jgi:hypothetical protein
VISLRIVVKADDISVRTRSIRAKCVDAAARLGAVGK